MLSIDKERKVSKVSKVLFQDLFKEKNIEKESKEKAQADDQILLLKGQKWLDNRDNYRHQPNITINVKLINPETGAVFPLYWGYFQIYGPEILDSYKVLLYPKDNGFLEIWKSNDCQKDNRVYLMQNDKILGQMTKSRFNDLCTVRNWSNQYNNNLNFKYELINLINYNNIKQIFQKGVECYEPKH